MAEHIHWKKTTNPDYFGTFAFETPDQEIIAKIKDIKAEEVRNPNGGAETKQVIYFDGDIKPDKMILNVTNMKSIAKATGTNYMDEWIGKKIQLYIDPAISAFGTVTEGVRIRDFAPGK